MYRFGGLSYSIIKMIKFVNIRGFIVSDWVGVDRLFVFFFLKNVVWYISMNYLCIG